MRPFAVGLAVAVFAAGLAVVLLLSGDDEGKKSENGRSAGTTQAQSQTVGTTTGSTAEAPTQTSRPRRHDEQQIERAVTTFVESAELGDSRRACSQIARGSGGRLPRCAEQAGIDPRTLPSSDELQIDTVKISGSRASAALSNGSTFSLERSGSGWKLTGLRIRPGGLNTQ